MNKKDWKKEYFSIPNVLSYIRILLLPVFLYLYNSASSSSEYKASFVLLVFIFMTDFVDGKIARKFNMITDFGKALDPVADKLTQWILAIAVALNYPLMKVFVVLFFCKEIGLGIVGLYLIKKKNTWTAAKWYGKIATAVIDLGILVLLFFYEIPQTVADIIILIMLFMMLFSMVKYLQYYLTFLKEERE